MSKRKGEAVSSRSSQPSSPSTPTASPSAKSRKWISLLIAIHFATMAIALSANLAPSFLHGEVLPWLAPLHVTSGQDYILLPLELTHAAKIDLPMAVEIRLVDQQKWRSLALPQIADKPAVADSQQIVNWSSSRSRWPNLSRLITWIALEQPSSTVLPEFSFQLLKYAAAHEQDIEIDQIAEIRLVQPHVLNYDEFVQLNRGQGELLANQLDAEIIYGAHVVHTATGEIRLLPMQEPALTAKPLSPFEGAKQP